MDGICVKCGPKISGFLVINGVPYIFKNSCRCPLNIYFDVSVICWNHVRFTLSSLKLNSNNANSELNWTGLVWALYLSSYPAYPAPSRLYGLDDIKITGLSIASYNVN